PHTPGAQLSCSKSTRPSSSMSSQVVRKCPRLTLPSGSPMQRGSPSSATPAPALPPRLPPTFVEPPTELIPPEEPPDPPLPLVACVPPVPPFTPIDVAAPSALSSAPPLPPLPAVPPPGLESSHPRCRQESAAPTQSSRDVARTTEDNDRPIRPHFAQTQGDGK